MLIVGQKIPNFRYMSNKGKNLDIYEQINTETIFYFLRYVGCSVCQLDLLEISTQIDDVRKRNMDIKIILQSNIENIEKIKSDIEIISDPDAEIYELLEIPVAKSKDELLGEHGLDRVLDAKSRGFVHGEYEGKELQLPAVVVVDKNAKIKYLHYAKNISDILMPDQIMNKL